MKALVLKDHRKLSYQEVPRPEIGRDEVLVEIKACGICGSDVHGYDGSTGRRVPPVIMGHEAAGIIREKGNRVSEFAVGDRVTFDSTLYCGECAFCTTGAVNLCDRRRVLGVSCQEYHCSGAMAEMVAVPARSLYLLPDTLSFSKAAMVEPVAIAVHGVGRTPIGLNDTALVVGCGIIGLLTIQVLRMAGCSTIFGVDIDPGRLELAREMGADIVLHGRDQEAVGTVLEQTRGRGVDHAFEVVGNTETVQICVDSLRKGGHLVLIGNFSPAVELPLQDVVSRQLTVYGSCASSGEYGVCLDLIARDRIRLDPLISAEVPLSEGAQWLHRLYQGEPGLMKVLLKP